MTDTRLKGPWSFWFDAHYNTRAFVVVRPGLTYRFPSGTSGSMGYARLWTDPGNGTLSRDEHRLWAQAFFPFTLSDWWSVSQRLRTDLRFRQNTQNGEVEEGYSFSPRFRSQTSLTFWFPKLREERFFVQSAWEILMNAGKNAGPNYLDQNRLSLLGGLKLKNYAVRAGYMSRFVPGASGTAKVREHDLILWLNFSFDPFASRSPHQPPRDRLPDNLPEEGGL